MFDTLRSSVVGSKRARLAPLAAVVFLVACGDDDAGSNLPASDVIADLVGEYNDGFQDHQVLADRWLIDASVFHIDWIHNASGALVAHNDGDNAFSPGLWSRFNWTTRREAIWYCQVAFAAESREAALQVADADASDLEGEGCGGFPWSPLAPAEPEIAGSYSDGFVDHEITWSTWTQTLDDSASLFHIAQTSNLGGFLVAQNDDANPFSPGQYSRFDWTRAADTLYVCQTVFDAATRAEAATADPADATDPTTGGCGGFPWSVMTPR